MLTVSLKDLVSKKSIAESFRKKTEKEGKTIFIIVFLVVLVLTFGFLNMFDFFSVNKKSSLLIEYMYKLYYQKCYLTSPGITMPDNISGNKDI